jgi:hypothetical protein
MKVTNVGIAAYATLLFIFGCLLQGSFADSECPCRIELKEGDGRDLPSLFSKFLEVEKCCENLANHFSDWAQHVCPENLAEVLSEVSQKIEKAVGGKSGQDVLLTNRFVIKRANPLEKASIDAILEKKRKQYQDRSVGEAREPSILAPICRKLTVEDPEDDERVFVYTIAPLIGMKNAGLFPDEVRFDLKGNYLWQNREAEAHESTQKDKNFHDKFPGGLYITDKKKRDEFRKAAEIDTKMLNDIGLMDYSFLVHAVEQMS